MRGLHEGKQSENIQHSFTVDESLCHMLTKCPRKLNVSASSLLLFSPQRLLSNEEEKNKEIIQEVCFMVSFIDPRSARKDQRLPISGVELQLFGGRRPWATRCVSQFKSDVVTSLSFLHNLWFSRQCGVECENHD